MSVNRDSTTEGKPAETGVFARAARERRSASNAAGIPYTWHALAAQNLPKLTATAEGDNSVLTDEAAWAMTARNALMRWMNENPFD